MRLSFFFPNYINDVGDPSTLRDFAQTLEGLGYWGIDAVDHIAYPWPRAQDRRGLPAAGHHQPWQTSIEPLSFLAALAPLTTHLRLRTSIIILPQREPILVAKQCASIDRLSGGRFELGVGVGWSEAEYAALGADCRTRGRRADEQLEIIQRCWTEEHVQFDGRYYQVDDMSVLPKPLQSPRPPIWIGGGRADLKPVMRRLGRYGDGWMVIGGFDADRIRDGLELAWAEAARASRPVGRFQVQAVLDATGEDWQATAEGQLKAFG